MTIDFKGNGEIVPLFFDATGSQGLIGILETYIPENTLINILKTWGYWAEVHRMTNNG